MTYIFCGTAKSANSTSQPLRRTGGDRRRHGYKASDRRDVTPTGARLRSDRPTSVGDFASSNSVFRFFHQTLEAIASRLEAIASRLEAIASRLEAIASRLEAIASRLEAIASRLEAIASRLEAIASRLEAIASRLEAIASRLEASC